MYGHYNALLLLVSILTPHSATGSAGMCEGSLKNLHIVGSRQNISNFITENCQKATTQGEIDSAHDSDVHLSSLLQKLQINPFDSRKNTNSDQVVVDSHSELREQIERMQRLLSTVPRGLLPGRFRTSLFPKLLVLDLNGLLLDRIKVQL